MNSLTGPHSYARTGDGGSRADRLLAAMHKVFSHDLPNQLVVVQSLLSLLQMEDEANLSQDGKEHLARLKGAAGRAGLLVDFLKEMARLSRLRENWEDLLLASLAREIKGELTHLFPEREPQVQASFDVATVTVGRRCLHQAILQLVRVGIEQVPQRAVTIHLSSHASAQGVDIGVGIEGRNGSVLSEGAAARQDRTLLQNRLEFILARELVATWDGTLSLTPLPERSCQFTIGVPPRVANA